MKINVLTENRRYRLSNYLVNLEKSGITALEFVYIKRKDVVREISHPASIDQNNQMLIIQNTEMKGRDTDFCPDDIFDLFDSLTQWDITEYYQIRDNCSDMIYACRNNMPVINSR